MLSVESPYADKLALAYFDIWNKYTNPEDMTPESIKALVRELGYGYILDLLATTDDNLSKILFLLPLIHYLKDSKLGLEVVFSLLQSNDKPVNTKVTVWHEANPVMDEDTFSVESDYSGKVSKYNPKGIIGGTWSATPNLGRNASRYTLSDSQMKHGWDVLRTIDYLSNAEQNGVELRMPNGSYPIIDGIRFGGVLPEITVIGKHKKYSLDTATPIELNY